MKNRTAHTGTLKIVKRLRRSMGETARFEIEVDGYRIVTLPDSTLSYQIEDHNGCLVEVIAGTHYGRLTLDQLTTPNCRHECGNAASG